MYIHLDSFTCSYSSEISAYLRHRRTSTPRVRSTTRGTPLPSTGNSRLYPRLARRCAEGCGEDPVPCRVEGRVESRGEAMPSGRGRLPQSHTNQYTLTSPHLCSHSPPQFTPPQLVLQIVCKVGGLDPACPPVSFPVGCNPPSPATEYICNKFRPQVRAREGKYLTHV